MNAPLRRLPVVRTLTIALLTLPVAVLGVPAAAGSDGCDDLAVTHTPEGTDGDGSAVAITSQVLVADVDGWESVTWESRDGVEIDHVVVSDRGDDRVVEGGPTGQAGPATALTFCLDAVATSAVGATVGDDPTRSLLGATIGVVLATLVLLLSHGARRERRSGAVPGGAA